MADPGPPVDPDPYMTTMPTLRGAAASLMRAEVEKKVVSPPLIFHLDLGATFSCLSLLCFTAPDLGRSHPSLRSPCTAHPRGHSCSRFPH